MALISLLLPLLLQAGAAPSLNLPQIDRPTAADRRRRAATIDRPTTLDTPNRLEACMAKARHDPTAALAFAADWLKQIKRADLAEPQLCLGTAHAALGNWDEAEAAFLAAQNATPAGEPLARARLGAMAGNAALAAGHADKALAELGAAQTLATPEPALNGAIAADLARALVALKREPEAASALAKARAATPEDAGVWLLSATLSRRMGKLDDAQTQIEQAARLAPADGDIGLEAGVIAMLAGHEAAARKSWQSVIAAAPDSEAGKHASAYLAQIGPGPATPARARPEATR